MDEITRVQKSKDTWDQLGNEPKTFYVNVLSKREFDMSGVSNDCYLTVAQLRTLSIGFVGRNMHTG